MKNKQEIYVNDCGSLAFTGELPQFLKKRHIHDIWCINTGKRNKRNRGEYLWQYKEVTFIMRI